MGCLASDSVTKNLFITGGMGISRLNSFQILDLESHSFIVSDQNMSEARRAPTCIVDEIDGYLYVIAGTTGGIPLPNSIEKISTDYATNASWDYFNGYLNSASALTGLRSIINNQKIFVIGGAGNTVHIIDIVAETVTLSEDPLFYQVSVPTAIIVDSRLYAFGGYYSGYLSTWQYYDLDVHTTVAPSEVPTYSPTIEPTYNPSLQPNIQPTKSPTIQPTITPTKFPSMEPTINPSNYPSISPTEFPSQAPITATTLTPSSTSTSKVALVMYLL